MYFLFIALFRKLYLASSAFSHGSEVTFPLFASHLASFSPKLFAALGTSKAEAHATHVSVAQHISKSIPVRYPCSASRHDFVLMQSPASDCMLPFADRKLYAEHKLKGGGVPSPEGLQ